MLIECDHDWEHVDESFDHEFGTEQVYFKRCRLCDAVIDDDEPSPEDDT